MFAPRVRMYVCVRCYLLSVLSVSVYMHENRKSWKLNTWVNNIENEMLAHIYTRTHTRRNTHIFMLEVTNDDDGGGNNDAYAKQAQPINC